MVQELLDKGANIEDKHGLAPLNWAAGYGYDTVVKLHIERTPTLGPKTNIGTRSLSSKFWTKARISRPRMRMARRHSDWRPETGMGSPSSNFYRKAPISRQHVSETPGQFCTSQQSLDISR